LAYFRDTSLPELIFVIGGADGLSEAVLERANEKLSFGRMVWAHMLARVMLAEQLYRGVSILAGGPYHRS
jgi:23S rRNA (pseudouridine1915-N3)-methyltransferase